MGSNQKGSGKSKVIKKKIKAMKSLDPNKRYTFASRSFPDTVFTYRAFSGLHILNMSDELYVEALNTCIDSVTNFIATVYKRDDDGKVLEEFEDKFFSEFIPAEYEEVEMNLALEHSIATALFMKIWNISQVTSEEVGE